MRLRQLRSSDNGRRLERNAWYHNHRLGSEGTEWTTIMLKKAAVGIGALILLSIVAIGVAYTQSPPNPQSPLAAPLTVERSSDRLSANAGWTPNQGAEYQAFAVVAKLLAGEPDTTGHGVKADTLRYIDWPLAGDVGRLTITQLDPGRDYVYGWQAWRGTARATGYGASGRWYGTPHPRRRRRQPRRQIQPLRHPLQRIRQPRLARRLRQPASCQATIRP